MHAFVNRTRPPDHYFLWNELNMLRVNDDYLKLRAGYLFPEIAKRVRAFREQNPDADVISLGIGDVTEPLPPAVVEAMHGAIDELATRGTFRGYGPEQGYAFLREKIVEHEYRARGCDISADEVFVSDGSKCDTGNILDILGPGNTIAIADPVYPVYVDTNVMAGHTGLSNDRGEYEGLVYLPATADNGFVPDLPDRPVDVVYLCFPNNPTGSVATKETLARWVRYAEENGTLILFDAAYEAFITDPEIPHSIYEVPGADRVAIEFRSFSKNAGFTGTRCAFTVVPKGVTGADGNGQSVPLHQLWSRRQTTKFNGVSYAVQRGAEAVYTEQGAKQVRGLIEHYQCNAKIIRETLADIGMRTYGGVNGPYIWLQIPGAGSGAGGPASGWDFFDKVLNQCHVVGTPGVGFGAAGEGYFRISSFNTRARVEEAMSRFRKKLSG